MDKGSTTQGTKGQFAREALIIGKTHVTVCCQNLTVSILP